VQCDLRRDRETHPQAPDRSDDSADLEMAAGEPAEKVLAALKTA
jgi:hypothetical protein